MVGFGTALDVFEQLSDGLGHLFHCLMISVEQLSDGLASSWAALMLHCMTSVYDFVDLREEQENTSDGKNNQNILKIEAPPPFGPRRPAPSLGRLVRSHSKH